MWTRATRWLRKLPVIIRNFVLTKHERSSSIPPSVSCPQQCSRACALWSVPVQTHARGQKLTELAIFLRQQACAHSHVGFLAVSCVLSPWSLHLSQFNMSLQQRCQAIGLGARKLKLSASHHHRAATQHPNVAIKSGQLRSARKLPLSFVCQVC